MFTNNVLEQYVASTKAVFGVDSLTMSNNTIGKYSNYRGYINYGGESGLSYGYPHFQNHVSKNPLQPIYCLPH